MTGIEVYPLAEGLSYGARIRGVTLEALKDEAIREQINQVFIERGMIAFENVEQTGEMQVEISKIFGPLKEHPVKSVSRVDEKLMPGVIEIKSSPDMCVVEINGEHLINWQPWHFDHCYNNELNKAGVLRAITNPPEGGRTAFADGIQIYNDMSPEILAKIQDKKIVYTLDLVYPHQRYGMPDGFKMVRELAPKVEEDILESAFNMPRAKHPAVWERETGEKVLHMCPYMSSGIDGQEDEAGDALFDEVWAEVERAMKPYYHEWKEGDMVVWDNHRMLHLACGCDPKFDRVMHRTTIKGDYGFGEFEAKPWRETDTRPIKVRDFA